MKRILYLLCLTSFIFTGCKDDDINLFDKTADERAAEAIANLKADLIAPANGWKLRYRPENGSGSFYVFLKFEDDNTVNIQTDLGVDDGEYFNQTITYRVDNSLGLELILENYSFFSYLFEQDDATFGAEYEFNFVNKTPDDALVFSSKTDFSNPTILLFVEAAADEADMLLGTALAQNLNAMSAGLGSLTQSYKLVYENKDLEFYLSLNDMRRTISFKSAARKSNIQIAQAMTFTTPYIVKGDSIVFDSPLTGSFLGNPITMKGIKFNNLEDAELNVCTDPIQVFSYAGVTSANDLVQLETTLLDASGSQFASQSDFFVCPISNIIDNGVFAGAAVAEDITGASSMQLYYNYDLGGDPFYAMGFFIQNSNGTTTFALREFTSTLVNNNLIVNFAPEISIFGSPTTANIDNVNIYLDAMTAGDATYILEYADGLYEFFNPCTGWSFVFFPIN